MFYNGTMSIKEIVSHFRIKGKFINFVPYGNGHINHSYLVTTTKSQYIVQHINTKVFKNIDELMENVVLITDYLRSKNVRTLNFVKTKDNKYLYKEKGCYRIYDYISEGIAFEQVKNKKMFKNLGNAFGEFQKNLSQFDASKLHEIIPDFHNTPKRFMDFDRAVKEDKLGRKADCQKEIKFVYKQRKKIWRIVSGLKRKQIPLRVAHNDTKLNNVLFDPKTYKPIAVIDLDTVMPGSLLYDFGDAIRYGASTGAEDETNLKNVNFSLPLFEAYSEGFLKSLKNKITPTEISLLPYSSMLMTFECGMRFLTDYLNGDEYFNISYPTHNLIRCRTQFKLAYQMEKRANDMSNVISKILKK